MRGADGIDRNRQAQIEVELLATMGKLKRAGEGFELLIAPGEEQVWAAVLQNIMQAHPDYALVMWPSGPGVVRRKDIDAINPDFKKVNESAGFINNGGSDFNIDDVDPRPLAGGGGGQISKKEFLKEMPDAAEKYGIPELGMKE
jgi:hypothetical protein